MEIKKSVIEIKVSKSIKILSTLQTFGSEINILSEPKDSDYTKKKDSDYFRLFTRYIPPNTTTAPPIS